METTIEYTISEQIIDGQKTYWRDCDGCRCLNNHDKTAGELFEYNSDCSLCWLGYGHSGDMHRRILHSFYAK